MAGIGRPDPHILEPAGIDRAQQDRDTVLEHLAADETGLGIGSGLPGEMLAGAEPDLEPDLFFRFREEPVRIQRNTGIGCVDRKQRQ